MLLRASHHVKNRTSETFSRFPGVIHAQSQLTESSERQHNTGYPIAKPSLLLRIP